LAQLDPKLLSPIKLRDVNLSGSLGASPLARCAARHEYKARQSPPYAVKAFKIPSLDARHKVVSNYAIVEHLPQNLVPALVPVLDTIDLLTTERI